MGVWNTFSGRALSCSCLRTSCRPLKGTFQPPQSLHLWPSWFCPSLGGSTFVHFPLPSGMFNAAAQCGGCMEYPLVLVRVVVMPYSSCVYLPVT